MPNIGARSSRAPIHDAFKQQMVANDERATELIFRTMHNTARVAKNAVSMEVVAAEKRGAKLVVKSKSMATEELHLNKALEGHALADLPIDSALKIAAHFFYLHSDKGKPVVHICVGINKVKMLSSEAAHPYHAAFCYQTIWGLEDHFKLLDNVKAPYSKEFKKKPPTDARILEVEQMVYTGMAQLPELRQALIDTYERNKAFLNFRLVY